MRHNFSLATQVVATLLLLSTGCTESPRRPSTIATDAAAPSADARVEETSTTPATDASADRGDEITPDALLDPRDTRRPDTTEKADRFTPVDTGTTEDTGTDSAPAPSGDGGFFGASRCKEGQFIFCEDFEGAQIDPQRWFYNGGNGSNGSGYSMIDGTRAARGNRSLHMHTELNKMGSGSQLHTRGPQPALANGFYLRAFMYIAQPIPDHHLNYFNVVDPTDKTGGMFSLGSLDGKLGMVEFGPHNGDNSVTADPLIVGRWFCVEWQVAPATSELRVWLDEIDVPALHVTNWSPSRFNELFLELISYQGAYDLWIDELAYDSQRIGCKR